MPAEPKAYEDLPVVDSFRVVRGRHHEGGRTYAKGEVVESKSDLLKHNSPGAIKFVRLSDNATLITEAEKAKKGAVPQDRSVAASPPTSEPVAYADDKGATEEELNSLTFQELKDYAAAEEIDLTGVRSKQDAIEVIKSHKR
jgi:hypothetical protein